MKKIILTCIALIGSMFAFSSLAVAENPVKADKPDTAKSIAQRQCKAFKKADKTAFKAVYGSNSIGKCVKAQTSPSGSDLKNAAKECKAEQAADPIAFEAKYGDDDPYNANNSFGKCVSSKVSEKTTADTGTFKNAAKACKAERASDPAAFEQKYGSAKSKGKNAFGKCVSTTVRATKAV